LNPKEDSLLKSKLVPLAAATGIIGVLLCPVHSQASTVDDIQKDLDRIKQMKTSAQQKVSQAQSQLAQINKEKSQTETDLNAIFDQIDQTNQKLVELDQKIETVTGDLRENARQLDAAEERVKARDNLLRSRIRLMYTNGTVSYIDVLMSSTSFADFLDRLMALQSIVNQDKEILQANIRDRDLIGEKKKQIEQQLAQVQDLYDQTSELKQTLLVQEKEKEVKIASLDKQAEDLQEISEQASRELTRIAQQEAAKQAELIRKRNEAGTVYTYSGGKLGYPLPKVYPVTSGFGSRTDPITGEKSAFHTGLDLGAPYGTNILAAEDGVVILAQWYSGYGNCVIIDHGNGLWTLYGHIHNDGIVVKKGDRVKRGQKIAEVGATGRATGNHLHFEVRVNGTATDPTPYLRG
jgi:murein DD-endopeptidase MepM/ murein hydrolase activator NlpD